MLGPLRSNVEFAETLIRHLKSPALKAKAQLISISSKLVLFHANDLLDLSFLQTGHFSPTFTNGSPSQAIIEIVDLVQATLEDENLSIELDIESVAEHYQVLKFDKRRLQQVLLNLLSNAVKF